MRIKRKIPGFFLILLTLLALSTLLVTSLWLAENSQRQGLPSIYSADDLGYVAAFKVLKRTVRRVYSGEGPLLRQFQAEPGVIITARESWTKKEKEEAARWMERGGVLILLSPFPEERGEDRPERSATVDTAWKGFSDLPGISIKASPGLVIQPADHAIYASIYGSEIAVRRVGEGRRIVFGSRDWLTNAALQENPSLSAVFIKLVALYSGGNRIVWDESFNIPVVQRRFRFSWAWLYAGIQLVLVGILYVFSNGRRLGPPIDIVTDSPLTLRDYLLSLADFYRRARGGRLILESLFGDLRLRLLRRTGLNPTVDDSRLVEAYHRMGGENPKRLSELLTNARRCLNGLSLDEKELFRLGKTIDGFRKELEQYVTR